MRIRRRCHHCHSYQYFPILVLCPIILTIIFIAISHSSNLSSVKSNQIFILDRNDLGDAKLKPVSNLQFLPQNYFNTSNLACRYPTLKIDDPDIWQHLHPVQQSKPQCEQDKNWVYVQNGQ